MEKFRKTEVIILAILWAMSIVSYSIALLLNYVLYTTDYFGLAGLSIVTLRVLLRPEKSFQSVFILLLFGLFNLLSFAYFFNLIFTFGVSGWFTPGIQLISLVMLSILAIRKRNDVIQFYRETFGRTEKEEEDARKSTQIGFKTKFNNLTDNEIDLKLQQNLVPEAIEALKEIKKEREVG
ncbi:hypothetical protein GC194_11975 [bacterium]|nr:hypothetical protein [bacterium]